MPVRSITCMVLSSILLLLGGCYFSQQRILKLGMDAPIEEGTYACRGASTEDIVVRKRREITADGVDVIFTAERHDYRLEPIRERLYLVQGQHESGAYSYMFIELSADGTVRLLVRKPQAADALKTLAGRHRLQTTSFGPLDEQDAMLAGTAADLRGFLQAIDMSMLTEQGTCARKAAAR